MSIFALKTLPIGDAAVIGQTGPVYTSILAWLFLGESMSVYLIVCLTLTVGGTVLVASPELFSNAPNPTVVPANISASNLMPFAPERYDNWPLLERLAPRFGVDFDKNNTVSDIVALQGAYDNQLFLAMVAAVLSAFISAVDNVILRSISAFVHSEVVIFYFAIEGSLLLLVPTIVSGQYQIPLWGWQPVIILTAGAAYFVDIYLSIQAYKFEKASILSLMRCVYSVFAFVWQVLIFHQKPARTALVGTLLVFIGVALVAYEKIRENRRGKRLLTTTNDAVVGSTVHAVADFSPRASLFESTSRNLPIDDETVTSCGSTTIVFDAKRKRWWHPVIERPQSSTLLDNLGERFGALRATLLPSSRSRLRPRPSVDNSPNAVCSIISPITETSQSSTSYGAI